jgi:hypothetical protein
MESKNIKPLILDEDGIPIQQGIRVPTENTRKINTFGRLKTMGGTDVYVDDDAAHPYYGLSVKKEPSYLNIALSGLPIITRTISEPSPSARSLPSDIKLMEYKEKEQKKPQKKKEIKSPRRRRLSWGKYLDYSKKSFWFKGYYSSSDELDKSHNSASDGEEKRVQSDNEILSDEELDFSL